MCSLRCGNLGKFNVVVRMFHCMRKATRVAFGVRQSVVIRRRWVDDVISLFFWQLSVVNRDAIDTSSGDNFIIKGVLR